MPHLQYVIVPVFWQSYTGKAWGVNLEMPLVVLLHIRSVSKYLDGVGKRRLGGGLRCGHSKQPYTYVRSLLDLGLSTSRRSTFGTTCYRPAEPLLEVFQDSPKQSGEKIKVGMGVQLKK